MWGVSEAYYFKVKFLTPSSSPEVIPDSFPGQMHEVMMPNNSRAGFLIGDGAGVGKGRTIAGELVVVLPIIF